MLEQGVLMRWQNVWLGEGHREIVREAVEVEDRKWTKGERMTEWDWGTDRVVDSGKDDKVAKQDER